MADGAARAVVDVEVALVVAADHPVADRDRDRPVGSLLAERAGARAGARARARSARGGSRCRARSSRSARRRAPRLRRPTRRPPARARSRSSVRTSTRPCVARPFDPPAGVAVVQRREREPLRRVALAHHLRQPDRADAARRPRAASRRLGPTASCPGSPIATTFAPTSAACASSRSLNRVERHPRLVEDHDAAARPGRSRRRSRATGCPASATRSPPARASSRAARPVGATPITRVAGALVELAQHAGGVGLAGPGERLDHIHPVARRARPRAPPPPAPRSTRAPLPRAPARPSRSRELRDASSPTRPAALASGRAHARRAPRSSASRRSSRARHRDQRTARPARAACRPASPAPRPPRTRATPPPHQTCSRAAVNPAGPVERLGELLLPHSRRRRRSSRPRRELAALEPLAARDP